MCLYISHLNTRLSVSLSVGVFFWTYSYILSVCFFSSLLLCFLLCTDTYYEKKTFFCFFFLFFLSLSSFVRIFDDDDDEKENDLIVCVFFSLARCVMSSSEELIELVRKLKRERSFVHAEQKHIREQYIQVIRRIFFPLEK